MPIRFRCAYCNQLMAISRRKANTVVRCPKCAGEIIVPVPEGSAPPVPEPRPVGGTGNNYDAYLDEPASGKTAPQTAASGYASVSEDSGELALPSLRRTGVFLPQWLLFVVGTLGVLVLIGTFALGFFLGRSR